MGILRENHVYSSNWTGYDIDYLKFREGKSKKFVIGSGWVFLPCDIDFIIGLCLQMLNKGVSFVNIVTIEDCMFNTVIHQQFLVLIKNAYDCSIINLCLFLQIYDWQPQNYPDNASIPDAIRSMYEPYHVTLKCDGEVGSLPSSYACIHSDLTLHVNYPILFDFISKINYRISFFSAVFSRFFTWNYHQKKS